MAYIVIKTIRGQRYRYWQRSFRERGRVRTQCRCLGRVDAALEGKQTNADPLADLITRAHMFPTLNAFVMDVAARFGAPLYHGTLAEFARFDDALMGSNTHWRNARLGIFFLEERARVVTFAEDTRTAGDTRDVQIKEAWLLVRRPLDVTQEKLFTNAAQAPLLVRLMTDEIMSPKAALRWINESVDLAEIADFYDQLYSHRNKAAIIAAGYDGIVSSFGRNGDGTTIREHVAFTSAQVLQRDDLAVIWRTAHSNSPANTQDALAPSRAELTNGTLTL